jgi:hypothetical protein
MAQQHNAAGSAQQRDNEMLQAVQDGTNNSSGSTQQRNNKMLEAAHNGATTG